MSTSAEPEKLIDYFVLVFKPDHPRAFPSGWVAEHVIVAEEKLGRYLTPDEDVKHANGDTRDNSPDNLKVVSSSYKVLSLTDKSSPSYRPPKNLVPCKYQKPCWARIRAPIAKKHKIFLPYICSYQSEGDIYMCGNFWSFHEEEISGGVTE